MSSISNLRTLFKKKINKTEELSQNTFIKRIEPKSSIKIDINRIFLTNLEICEKILIKATKNDRNSVLTKHSLMESFFLTKIKIARFLSLYRWASKNNEQSDQGPISDKIDYLSRSSINSLTLIFHNLFIKHKYQMNSHISIPRFRLSFKIDYYSRKTPLFNLFCANTPSTITGVFFSRNSFKITYSNIFTLLFSYGKNYKIILKSFSISLKKPFFEYLKIFTEALLILIEKSNHLLIDIEKIFKKFILNIYLNTLHHKFIKYQFYYNLISKIEGNKLNLYFHENFYPFNQFNFLVECSKVRVFSSIPHFDKENTKFYSFTILNSMSTDFILMNLWKSTFYSFLKHKYFQFLTAINDINNNNLKINIYSTSIELIYNSISLFLIDFNIKNGNFQIFKHHSLFLNEQIFINLFQSDKKEYYFFLKSLLKQYLLNEILPNKLQIWNPYINFNNDFKIYIFFSFSPDFPVILDSCLSKGQIYLRNIQDTLTNYSKICSYQRSCQLQLFKLLNNSNIDVSQKDGYISFSMEPFSKISFSFLSEYSWKINIITINHQLDGKGGWSIYGSSLSCRFISWILYIISLITRLSSMKSQSEMASISSPQTLFFHSNNSLSFNFEILNVPSPKLGVFISGLNYLYNNKRGYDIYTISKLDLPLLNIEFSRWSKLRWHTYNLTKGPYVHSKFGSFLMSSLIPLHHVQKVFLSELKNSTWSTTMLSDDFSFSLVFKRRFSLNIIWKVSQVFQVIIPITSPSSILQIPLSALDGFTPAKRLSHPTVRVSSNNLIDLKNAIEEFFYDRDVIVLTKCKPRDHKGNILEFEQPHQSSWISMSIELCPSGLQISLKKNNSLSSRLTKVFVEPCQNRNLRRLRLKFLVKLAEIRETSSCHIVNILELINSLPGIDWESILSDSSIDSTQNIVKFLNISFIYGTFAFDMDVSDDVEPIITLFSENIDTKSVFNYASFCSWLVNFEVNTFL